MNPDVVARVQQVLDEIDMRAPEAASVVPPLVEDADEIDSGSAAFEKRREGARGTYVGVDDIEAG
jgi:hypothetical protein